MVVMVLLLVIRSIYRAIELSDGWRGKVISTQWFFGTSSHLRIHIHAWEGMSADI
jgi:hypothetical protein